MSQVHLLESRHLDDERAIPALWSRSGLGSIFGANDLTAIKLHVGEPGRDTHQRPFVAAALVDCVASSGARPFLTDSAVLYRSPRDTGPGHARVAHDHGFGLERVGAPFVPADGLLGLDEVEIPLDGRHYGSIPVAAAIAQCNSALLLSHVTGHLATGLGAALKNLGMGCTSRKGKLSQHHGQQPGIDAERCTACGTCADWCPAGAISIDRIASIDADSCIGCGECIAVCREGAVVFDWRRRGRELQERMVEHAAGVVRAMAGRIAYVSDATLVTADCDCMAFSQDPIVDDIGLLASRDPVAIDAAALDLIEQSAGKSLENLSYPERDAAVQLRYAERLGLGSTDYDLIRVEV